MLPFRQWHFISETAFLKLQLQPWTPKGLRTSPGAQPRSGHLGVYLPGDPQSWRLQITWRPREWRGRSNAPVWTSTSHMPFLCVFDPKITPVCGVIALPTHNRNQHLGLHPPSVFPLPSSPPLTLSLGAGFLQNWKLTASGGFSWGGAVGCWGCVTSPALLLTCHLGQMNEFLYAQSSHLYKGNIN